MLNSFFYLQFSSVQSLSHVQLFVTPWITACQASLSITNSPSLLKRMSIESVMPSSHLILCLLPYISINSSNDVQTGGFGSTDQKQSFWTSLVSEFAWPTINIKINGKRFSGLLDTGSDITIISKHLWPKSWPVQNISSQTAGIFQTKVQEVYQSTQIYPCEGPEGQPAILRPYVIDAPLNLIGRDLLMQWQTQLYIPHFP